MAGVEAKAISLPVNGGSLTALDFGGTGHPVLLVHGSGHNAAAWTDVAFHLTDYCRVVAVDLRGHGQTRIDSSNAEQYWHDLAGATQSLGWEKPVLVGHSLGGYAVTAVTASGQIRPHAVCVVDGLVLDDRETAVAKQRKWTTLEAMDQVRAQFHYGWSAGPDQIREFIEQSVREAPDDWLNQGSRPGLLRKVLERSFSRHEHSWLRRPTPEQIAVISAPSPDASVHPVWRSTNTSRALSPSCSPNGASMPPVGPRCELSSRLAAKGNSWQWTPTTTSRWPDQPSLPVSSST